MIKNLGISVYPTKTDLQSTLNYINAAADNGFTRLFIAFLGVEPKREAVKAAFGPVIQLAKERGMEVSVDVHPEHIKGLSEKPTGFLQTDLSFFKELNIDILRLDLGYSEMEEAYMSKNQEGLSIELNMSMKSQHIEAVINSGGAKERILGCHNYYPHAYTGLSLQHFKECTDVWNKNSIRTAAFICSQSEEKIGPWPVSDGLTTLEMHRYLPIETQAKHYVAMDIIDDVFIGDVATIDELQILGKLNRKDFSLKIVPNKTIPEKIKNILKLNFSCRPDINENMIRTVESRLMFMKSGANIEPFNTVDIKRGDITIDNDLYGQYAGEVQIALKDMKNSGRTNVVGHVRGDEIFLIDYIKAGQNFKFEIE